MSTSLHEANESGERRACPVCASSERGRVVFEERIDAAALGPMSFSSRKTPEFFSFQLERCPTCSVLYAARIPREEWLLNAYRNAGYDSGEEADLAAETYARALRPLWERWPMRGPALEIGTGNGSFLPFLRNAGFGPVIGIEPSEAAVQAADPAVRPWIRLGRFDPRQYERDSFAFVCSFQTFEHVSCPLDILSGMFTLLRPGGRAALVVHDWTSSINRALGRKSPIVDIEHLQLFSRESLATLASRAGFRVGTIGVIRNRYALRYWLKLSPMPSRLKALLGTGLHRTGLGSVRLGLNVGNLLAVLEKPAVAVGTGRV
jgi:SAM-dependent methyltransferase